MSRAIFEQKISRRCWTIDVSLHQSRHLPPAPLHSYLIDKEIKNGLRITGERNGKPFVFSIKPELLPTYGMCTDVSRFYTFYNNEFLEFFPERESTAKWLLATEENHRRAGGFWKDFPWK